MNNASGLMLGIGAVVIIGAYFLTRGAGTLYSIGDHITYCGNYYLVINNREKDSQGSLYYQLLDESTNIAYWRLASDVDANICVM